MHGYICDPKFDGEYTAYPTHPAHVWYLLAECRNVLSAMPNDLQPF